MEDKNKVTCASCGAEVAEGSAFCTSCGAAMAAPPTPPPGTAIEAPPPLAPPPGAAYEAAPPVPGTAPAAAPRRSKAPLVLGIVGGLLIAGCVVVVLLGWAVGPKWFAAGSKGGGSGSPIALAEKFMRALENGDFDAYMACFEKDFLKDGIEDSAFTEGLGFSEEDIMEYAKMAFEMMDVKFDGVELEVTSEKGDKATVVTAGGSMTMAFFGFETEIDLAKTPLKFNMIKVGGTWYLTENPLEAATDTAFDVDADLEDYLDMDLEDIVPEDMQDILPEGMDLGDLEDMTPEELEQLLEELEFWLQEEVPSGGQGTTS